MIFLVVKLKVLCTKLQILNCNRNSDGWNVNCNQVKLGNKWNAENLLLLETSNFLPRVFTREFFLKIVSIQKASCLFPLILQTKRQTAYL